MGIIPGRYNRAIDFILNDYRKGEKIKVLDIGCGEGIIAEILRKKIGDNLSTVGVDISEVALRLAEQFYDETHRIDVDNESLSNLFIGQKFNYAVCLEVMEHIIYPERLLNEIGKVLEQDGKLITSVPNFAFFKNRLIVLKGRFPEKQRVFHSAEHIHYFTFHSFKKLLNEKGFISLAFGGTFELPRPLSYLPQAFQKSLFHRFPNSFGKQVVFCCNKKSSEMKGDENE